MHKFLFDSKTKKLLWLFFLFVLMLYILLSSVYSIINEDKTLKGLTYHKKHLAVRGDIISSNKKPNYGFTLAKSILLYKASIDTRYLDPDKKDLFISLFSLYSGIDQQTIKSKIDNQKKKGYLILSHSIPAHTAASLRYLAKRLLGFKHEGNLVKVFKGLKNKRSFYSGLVISESGGKRLNPYGDTMTPLIGYNKRYETKNNITRIHGLKGLEKYYDKQLNSYKNGIVIGDKDVVGNAILSKNSTFKASKNGNDIKLNISLKLQKEIELMSDIFKNKFQAKEILVSVMESNTGRILALSSSNRYNPQNIKQDEISHLTVNAVEMQFEPGSVIKPIAMALVFDKNRTNTNELIRVKKAGYKIGRRVIRDDHQFKKHYITPSDIITYSSNIGILQLAQRLNAKEFLDGYHSFGLGKKTGVDIADEKSGLLHSLKQYRAGEAKGKDNIFKATDSYGQGILSTFIQVLTAYNVFNNNGYLLKPKVGSHIKVEDAKKVISKDTTNIIKKVLIRTVNVGTGKATKIDGIEIGGKTGTAQIARKGKYLNRYISSFFGFANFKDKKYTIGVTVFEPSYKYHYASQSAVPIFRDVVSVLHNL